MHRLTLITSIMLVTASAAFAQSDEEIIETLRTSIAKVLLEQMPGELPESFLNSGLAPSDKERIMLQLVNDSAACFTDSLVEYAALRDVPLSDFVSEDSEGAIHFDGDSANESANEYEQLLVPCLLAAKQAAGVSKE